MADETSPKGRDPDEERDENEPTEPVVRDKRRIDPETGKVRGAPDGAPQPEQGDVEPARDEEGFEGPDVEESLSDADLDFLSGQSNAEDLAAERLADLQRVTAEYANYRKRTEAGREADRERAVGDVVLALLPVLDDLDRAEKHGDLEGDAPFATIAAKLRATVERLGAEPFGKPGEEFDHNEHDALFQQPSSDVEVPTISEVIETGYRLGSTLLRAAKVVVAAPQA